MQKKTVAIVGYGAVGRYLKNLFPDAAVYDEPLGIGSREEVNLCQYAFVAVPTNPRVDGSADTSVVEDNSVARDRPDRDPVHHPGGDDGTATAGDR